MNDLLQQLSAIEAWAKDGLKAISSLQDAERCRIQYLGRSGLVTTLLRGLSSLPPDLRPSVGKKANQLKAFIEGELDQIILSFKRSTCDEVLARSIDVTLPGRGISYGRVHPIFQVLSEVQDIFVKLGFSIYEGPEIETDYYNFEALNVPADHPARDMQDTFYIRVPIRPHPHPPLNKGREREGSKLLLRTHTSPVQIHVMKALKPPLAVIAPGAVYRRDADISHSPMFHQVEGFMADRHIRFSDLKGVLECFIHQIFGEDVNSRFRPSYFPFTEPSAEVDISCVVCKGRGGCSVCKNTGWMEILGAGMIHPDVFTAVGYDPGKVTGFAFGMGIERIAMIKFGISDIRMFYENDVRVLKQF